MPRSDGVSHGVSDGASDGDPNPVRTVVRAAVGPLLLFGLLTALLARHGWRPFPGELSLHSWAVTHRPAAAAQAVGVLTDLGTGVPPYLAAVLAGVLAARHPLVPRRRFVRLLAPVAVLALGQLLRRGLAEAFARPRPPAADWVAASPSGYAYPSGHAFTAAVAAGLLAWAVAHCVRRRLAAPVLALLAVTAAAVGLSRVYLGVHWPLDVLGSWLLAAGWLGLTLPLLTALLPTARPTDTPAVGP
ncbi:phosphatase PAP2 family protein [Kitasatospora sp. NPDC049258]|uniref:phosphatase PAP2 family protein n=1 Tax=Kitasatospora sp. NPDC049258 TaxID=3155394 RepID=UPI003439BF52